MSTEKSQRKKNKLDSRPIDKPVDECLESIPDSFAPLIEDKVDCERVRGYLDGTLDRIMDTLLGSEYRGEEWERYKMALDIILCFRLRMCGRNMTSEAIDAIHNIGFMQDQKDAMKNSETEPPKDNEVM